MQHSTTRQAKQKTCANLDHHLSKKMLISLCANKLGLSIRNSEILTLTPVLSHWLWLMTLTRVSSHWLWLDSSHSVKKRDSSWFKSPFFSPSLDSSASHH